MRTALVYTLIVMLAGQFSPSLAGATSSCENALIGSLEAQLAAAKEELAKPEELRKSKDPRLFLSLRNPATNPVTLALSAKVEEISRRIEKEKAFESRRIEMEQVAPDILGYAIHRPAVTVMARAMARLHTSLITDVLQRFKEITDLQQVRQAGLPEPETAVLTVLSLEYGKSPSAIMDLFAQIQRLPPLLGLGEFSSMKICIIMSMSLRFKLPPRDIGKRFIKFTLSKAFEPEPDEGDDSAGYSRWDPSSTRFMAGGTLDFVTGSGSLGGAEHSFGFDHDMDFSNDTFSGGHSGMGGSSF